jgi:glyoxylate/hydroxypyruvate reductase A
MNTPIPLVARLGADDERDWLHALRAALPEQTIVPFGDLTREQRRAVDVAIVANPDPDQLLDLPNLTWVQSLWAGVEELLSRAAKADFEIVRMTDPHLASTMADSVLAWTLYLHHDMPLYQAQQQAKIWRQHPLRQSSERNVGVLGLGNLGKASAAKLAGHGFSVHGWSRSRTEISGVATFTGEQGFGEVVSRSDVLVCLLPLTNETRLLLNRERLALLPNGAAVINFARGPIIDHEALIEYLDAGHLSHAVLDVFDVEPLPRENLLWTHPSVTVLPHISAPTNIQTASLIAAENISRYRATGIIPQGINRARGY